METVGRTNKSRLVRTFAKVLHIRAATGVAPVPGIHKKITFGEKIKLDVFDDDVDEKLRHKIATEAFLSKLFATVSTVKAAYSQLQFAQFPYDADEIQAADQMVVSELKNLSELKQCYLKKQFEEPFPEKTQLLADIQEQKSLIKTYEVFGKKLDSELKLKISEIIFLKEKLDEANKENKLIEKRLNSSGLLTPVADNLHLSGLSPNHFISFLRQTAKSIQSFVRLMITDMELARWDLDAAVRAIEPGVRFSNPNHICFAFESFVCCQMFDGFNYPNFSLWNESLPEQPKKCRFFFERFKQLKSMRTREILFQNPKPAFARFCSAKYLKLVHPKMETSLFGNLNQRKLVKSGDHPETTFFATFAEMAKRVWLLHCLAFSFDPDASIFQAGEGCRFSEVYMESVSEEVFISSDGSTETDPTVAFTVVPGFKIGKTVIQCQVYLSGS